MTPSTGGALTHTINILSIIFLIVYHHHRQHRDCWHGQSELMSGGILKWDVAWAKGIEHHSVFAEGLTCL